MKKTLTGLVLVSPERCVRVSPEDFALKYNLGKWQLGNLCLCEMGEVSRPP